MELTSVSAGLMLRIFFGLSNSNHVPLLPPSASAWIRRTVAEAIRSRNPYAVSLLLGGYDTTTATPHLYWIDYLGTKAIVPYAAHGLGMYVALSTMDKWWQPEMGAAEGIEVLRRCINEVEKSWFLLFLFPWLEGPRWIGLMEMK